jgi:hypothetical protein
MKLVKAGELVKEDIEEKLHDMDFPPGNTGGACG